MPPTVALLLKRVGMRLRSPGKMDQVARVHHGDKREIQQNETAANCVTAAELTITLPLDRATKRPTILSKIGDVVSA